MYEELYALERDPSGLDVARSYTLGEAVGWREEVARDAFSVVGGMTNSYGSLVFKALGLDGRAIAGRKTMLYLACRKVLGQDTPNYPQQIGDPFAAGTMVLMADGTERPIERVCVGDLVLNHKNEPARVTNVIEKKFTGRMITVRLKGWHRELTATETHHGMLVPESKGRFRYDNCERVRFGDVKAGDFMLTPFGLDAAERVVLDLKEWVDCSGSDDEFVYQGKNRLPRFVTVGEDFGRLMGLYLAKGGCGPGVVTFSLNADETALMEEVDCLVLKLFGLAATRHKTGCVNCTRVAVNSAFLADVMKALVPGSLYSKRVPPFFYRTAAAVKMALLRGWYGGDGHKSKLAAAVIGYTSSPGLGDDMARLGTSCGLNVSSWVRGVRPRASVPSTEVALYGGEAHHLFGRGLVAARKRATNKRRRTPYGMVRRVIDVKEEVVEDRTVYCITTENEYTAVFNGVGQFQCVSFGGKNAAEYLTCLDMLMRGKSEKWRPVFPPYYYGTSRVQIGGQHDTQDGSTGAWLAAAVVKYGTLFADEQGVPAYSGQVAKKWGYSGPPDNFIPTAQKYLVHSAAIINSWDDLVAAIGNGYPCTTASNVGYEMEASSDGFHHRDKPWGHQMCFIGVGSSPEPYAIILNNWGSCHGQLKDFDDNSNLPVGVLRVRQRDAEAHIAAGETYAWSQFDGFHQQDIDAALFKVVGT